jgi:hypothetical protein
MSAKTYFLFFLIGCGIFGSFSSIYIVHYDYIYSIQEIFNFTEKKIYYDYFPFVGIASPLFFGYIFSLFPNKILFIICTSFFANILFTQIFFKITYFITKNKAYSYCAGLTGAIWFATNFGLIFYQDYVCYYFFLLAIYFSLKRDIKINNYLTALFLLICFHFKNSIGIIAITVFFFVDLLTNQENINFKDKIKTLFFFILFFSFSIYFIYLFFDFYNYIKYTFKILITEGSTRFKAQDNFNLNNFYFLLIYEIFYNFIFPYKINIIESFQEKSMGRILFLPFILIFYFLYFVSLSNLFRVISGKAINDHLFTLYLILLSTFFISVIAGRNFTQLTFGIPIIAFNSLFFLTKKNKTIYLSILTIVFFVTGMAYKYYHSKFYESKYNQPISTKEISPLYFYNQKNKIDTVKLLNAYDYIKNNKLEKIVYLGHNSKVISFLTGEQGLEFDTYYHNNMSKSRDLYSYDCILSGLKECEINLNNHITKYNVNTIVISDDFYYHTLENFNKFLKKKFNIIYLDGSISIFQKK